MYRRSTTTRGDALGRRPHPGAMSCSTFLSAVHFAFPAIADDHLPVLSVSVISLTGTIPVANG